jgi:thiaminase/transcriptional activator TenA
VSGVAGLITRHAELWQSATQHAFLNAVRDGRLPPSAFAAWLEQDYLYVGDLLVFQARLLSRAPRSAQAVLISGLAALEGELGWFEDLARQRGLALGAAYHPTTGAYREFLVELEARPYSGAIAALWAIEAAYLEAWQTAARGHAEYRDFVEHWTMPAFAEYVADLERAAEASLLSAEDETAANVAFTEVARLERAFWDMAWLPGPQTSSA